MNDAGILMNVQFLRRAKITGKKVMAGLIFASPLDATLRRRRSDRALVMGVIVKVHCFSVVFCCLHTLLTSYIIFVSRTMMHVVKILRLLAAVCTFKIALFLLMLLCMLIHGWTMMHVVKILRLLAAVCTFKIALFADVTLHAHTWLVSKQPY
ncbi:hypothetical protein Bca52824_051218 [Brassica carinata]|uniref:Uncharacterized protein n=1 Tax=Brassica carinata TaxID=52824 RepID=A0A8X7QZU7_BRACI|nr:hypothetical protein Bca52824_051218 [Brassica carinata]